MDDLYLQILMLLFAVFGAALIIPGNLLNQKYGIQATVKIGCFLTLLGSFLAYFIYLNFWFFFLGHILRSVGVAFRIIASSQFTANWFFPKDRLLIMVLITLIFNACSGIASRVPLWVLGNYEFTQNSIDQGKNLI